RCTNKQKKQEIEQRGQTSKQAHPSTYPNKIPSIQPIRDHQSLSPTGAQPPQQDERQIRRRQKPERVQRRSSSTSRISYGTRTARRPHTGRSQHTMEPSRQGRRHIQALRGYQETLRSPRRNR